MAGPVLGDVIADVLLLTGPWSSSVWVECAKVCSVYMSVCAPYTPYSVKIIVLVRNTEYSVNNLVKEFVRIRWANANVRNASATLSVN